MNHILFGAMALTGLSCLSTYAEGIYKNPFGFYSWFTGVWGLTYLHYCLDG